MHLEQEIKFALDPDSAATLLGDKRVRRAARGEGQTAHLESTYYDTPRHALRKAGAALRVRAVDGRFEQTLKLATAGPAGLQTCAEWTHPLETPQPDLQRFDARATQHLPSRGRKLTLEPLFTSSVERHSLVLGHHKTRFELALDVGHLRSHAGRGDQLPICEVEFELLRGSALRMLDFLIELAGKFDLRLLRPSKAERGYALARPSLRPRLVKAEAVSLDRELSVGEAFQRITDEALRHLYSNHDPVMRGEPGAVHQTRVAIRRIRAALRAFRRELPWEWRAAFEGEFRRYQERLAPARDWQVFLVETLPLIADTGDADERSLARLRALALHERKAAMQEVRRALTGRRYTQLLLQFQRWLLLLAANGDKGLAKPLAPFAVRTLDATRREFLDDARPLSRMSEEERHLLRKAGKKARYATEFFADLWDGDDAPQVTRYLAAMEALQDRLGEANDAVVARHLMAGVAPRHARPEVLLLVQRWSQAREQVCVRAAQPAWRRVREAEPFWS